MSLGWYFLHPAVVLSDCKLRWKLMVVSISWDSGEMKEKNMAGADFGKALGWEDWARTELQGRGCSDIWWCSHKLHLGRVGLAGSLSEEPLQRCDAGDRQEPHCYRMQMGRLQYRRTLSNINSLNSPVGWHRLSEWIRIKVQLCVACKNSLSEYRPGGKG